MVETQSSPPTNDVAFGSGECDVVVVTVLYAAIFGGSHTCSRVNTEYAIYF